jgi:hypothetical protein
MPKPRKTSPAAARRTARKTTALDLRRRGYSFERIADALGCSVGTAHGDVKRALALAAEKLSEDASEHLALDLQRVDAMLAALWPAIEAGDPQAVEKGLKAMERRAKLLGLDAATRTELSGPQGAPIAVTDARAALAAAIARVAPGPDPSAAGGGSGEPTG